MTSCNPAYYTPGKFPLVSVAIPLYRSKPFLNCIYTNINNIRYPNVELLISDQYLADDALELLRNTYRDDTRIKYYSGKTSMSWVEHYNFLLIQASGKYFMWMPHDDFFPKDYLNKLVYELELTPNAVLAFGRIERVDDHDVPLPKSTFPDPPPLAETSWTLDVPLRLLAEWRLGVPFRGIFRRYEIVRRQLFIRSTRHNIFADKYWVWAVGLLGALRFVPQCTSRKRYHAMSAHAAWKTSILHRLSAFRVMHSYARTLVGCNFTLLRIDLTLFIWLCYDWAKSRKYHQLEHLLKLAFDRLADTFKKFRPRQPRL